jgi:hypothetical protein
MQQAGHHQRQPMLATLASWFAPASLPQQRLRRAFQRTQAATRRLAGCRVRRRWAVPGELLRTDDDDASRVMATDRMTDSA